MQTFIKRFFLLILILGVLFVSLYAFSEAIRYFSGAESIPGDRFDYTNRRIAIILHAGFGTFALFTGAIQMFARFRKKFPLGNLRLRKIYYVSVLISSLSGFLLVPGAQGGLSNQIGFFTLDLVWLYSIIMTYRADRAKNMPLFRMWIVRSYALTFAAVTLRLWIPILWSFYGFEQEAFMTIYATLGWLCWVPNLLFIEWFYATKHWSKIEK